MAERQTREEYIKNLTGKEMPKKEEKKVEEKKDKKILCIIGTAGSRHLAPYDNPNAEIWGVAHCLLLQDIPRMDKVFEIHLPYVYEQEISPFSKKPILYHANKEDHASWREAKDISAIVSQPNKKLNKYELFPHDELKEKYGCLFPPSDAFYSTNSLAWMMVYAIDMDRFDEIHMYGVHLETDTEWQYERPCCEFWLGFFVGKMHERGIKMPVIYLPEMADVLKCNHEYGYSEIEVQRKKYKERVEFFEKQQRDVIAHRNRMAEELRKLKTEIELPHEEKRKMLQKQYELYKKELKIMEEKKEEEYQKIIKGNITKRMQELNNEIYKFDCKISTINGAIEQTRYTLKQFNC